MTLSRINLSLSNRCNAKCIWCPTSRGTKHNFDMPKETAFKVIDEISEMSTINSMFFSENGEGIYNNDFIEIVSYARQKLPNSYFNMLSNFGMMTPELSKQILENKLIDEFQVNIDGHDAESYYAVKKISYRSVIKNLTQYLELRKKYHPEQMFIVNAVPAAQYAITIKSLLQTQPDQVQVEDQIPYSNLQAIQQSLDELDKKYNLSLIRQQSPGLWAERKTFRRAIKNMNIDQSNMNCPMFDRVKSEAFIAPNGDWYPCCLDDNNDIVLGNVNTQTVQEIYTSQRRLEFVEKLKNRQYEEIGYPCNTVACCHHNHMPKEILQEMVKDFKPGDMINLSNNG